MEKKENNSINKFLNFELLPEEEETFKNSIAYQKYQQALELIDSAQAIPFNENTLLDKININKVETSTNDKKVIPLYKKWLPISIAASIMLFASIFYLNSSKPISYDTVAGQSIQFSLPDASSVWLNAKSKISHNKDWDNSRDILLEGEAYFEVAKGKKFTVKTPEGIVTVLGTKFNVKQRVDYFEVHCFEGRVSVTFEGKETILSANNFFNSKQSNKQQRKSIKPNWIHHKSVFKNTPIREVITDINVQYNVEFILNENIKEQQLNYTGNYYYSDSLETVLTVLCKSLKLNYRIKSDHIYLSVKE